MHCTLLVAAGALYFILDLVWVPYGEFICKISHPLTLSLCASVLSQTKSTHRLDGDH